MDDPNVERVLSGHMILRQTTTPPSGQAYYATRTTPIRYLIDIASSQLLGLFSLRPGGNFIHQGNLQDSRPNE